MFEISKEDILARLAFDNPWWETKEGVKIAFQNTPRRKYFDSFLHAVKETSINRAVILMGPRRVGKTVMVYHAIRSLIDSGIDGQAILYLSLETPVYTGLTLERLIGYFQERYNHTRDDRLWIFFDEIQYHKNWEVHLKSLVDSFPQYKFVVTGSAAAALRLKSNESGAGRFSEYVLPPLTFAEYLMFIKRESELVEVHHENNPSKYSCKNIQELNKEFVNYLNFGGYPEAVFSQTVRDDTAQFIKSDIIDKVLLRDLPSLYGISDIQELNRLFTTLAYNSGNEVSLDNLSKSSGVAKNTIKRYLEYLEAAFLIRRVERIDNNAARFKRAVCFKVYLTNPSMRAALFGKLEADSEAMGSLVETAIFSQWQHNESIELYYARWNTGEVDIVHMPSSTTLKPRWIVEVKWTDRPYHDHRELDNCVEFLNRNPSITNEAKITSLTISDEHVEYKSKLFSFIPASLYAYTLGVNILKRKHVFVASLPVEPFDTKN
jgi:predicted AAA+ superfamily ATPase